jgi:hypothetical protein
LTIPSPLRLSGNSLTPSAYTISLTT